MGDRVAVDTNVSSDLFYLAATGEWEDAPVYQHCYLLEFLLCTECVGDFVDVVVALILLEETSVGCDDPCGFWHLELYVCVVWDCHELSECWSAKYSVVLGLKIHHFKF